MATKFSSLKTQYQKSLKRFEEILQEKESVPVRDSSIKRFEITLDLAWKLMKAFLEEKKGVYCASPKECVKEAYRNGALKYSNLWVSMVDWRNAAVHTYDEKFAESLYKKLSRTLRLFKELGKSMDKQ